MYKLKEIQVISIREGGMVHWTVNYTGQQLFKIFLSYLYHNDDYISNISTRKIFFKYHIFPTTDFVCLCAFTYKPNVVNDGHIINIA